MAPEEVPQRSYRIINVLKIILSKTPFAGIPVAALIEIKDVIEDDRILVMVFPDHVFEECSKKAHDILSEKDAYKLYSDHPILRFFSKLDRPMLMYSLRWLREGKVSIHDWTIYAGDEYCKIIYASKYGRDDGERKIKEAIKEGKSKVLISFAETLKLFSIDPKPEYTDILHLCLEMVFALYKLKGKRVSEELKRLLKRFREYYAADKKATEEETQKAYGVIRKAIKELSEVKS